MTRGASKNGYVAIDVVEFKYIEQDCNLSPPDAKPIPTTPSPPTTTLAPTTVPTTTIEPTEPPDCTYETNYIACLWLRNLKNLDGKNIN